MPRHSIGKTVTMESKGDIVNRMRKLITESIARIMRRKANEHEHIAQPTERLDPAREI